MQAIWRHLLAECQSTLGQHVGGLIGRYLIDLLADYWLTCQPSLGQYVDWHESADRWSSYWLTSGWTVTFFFSQHIDCIMADISTDSVAQLVCWPILVSMLIKEASFIQLRFYWYLAISFSLVIISWLLKFLFPRQQFLRHFGSFDQSSVRKWQVSV